MHSPKHDREPGITGDVLVETIDGPMAIERLVGKSIPLLTRLPDGRVGFRIMRDIRRIGERVSVLRIQLDNGFAVTASADLIFYQKGMTAVAAQDLQPGNRLETSWHFPEGYVSPTGIVSEGCFQVVDIEPAGAADVFNGAVNETHRYYLTSGVLCGDCA